jgi:hypothetical protein
MFFKNEINNGLKIVDAIKRRKNYLILKGETQSGKTGSYLSSLCLLYSNMFERFNTFQNILIISGYNYNDLYNQTRNSVETKLLDEIIESKNVLLMKNSHFNGYNSTCFSVGINEDIPFPTTLDNSIIIIDESHFGTTKKDHKLIKFLESFDIKLNGETHIENRNIVIMSVSATPYKEEFVNDNYKEVIKLETGNGYIGLVQFEKQIKQPIKGNYDFIEICEEIKDTFENMNNLHDTIIIRVSKKRINDVKEYCKKYVSPRNIRCFSSDDKSLDYTEIYNFIKRPVKKVVFIKGALRMGMVMPLECKEKIAMVYDVTTSLKNLETTEQSLLGRLCGYWADNEEWKKIKFVINTLHYNALYYGKTNNVNPYRYKWYCEKETFIDWSDTPKDGYIKKLVHIDEPVLLHTPNEKEKSYLLEMYENGIILNKEFKVRKLLNDNGYKGKDFIKPLFPTYKAYNLQYNGFFKTNMVGINQRQETFLNKYDPNKTYIEPFVDVVFNEELVAIDIKGIYGRESKIMWGLKGNVQQENNFKLDIEKDCESFVPVASIHK